MLQEFHRKKSSWERKYPDRNFNMLQTAENEWHLNDMLTPDKHGIIKKLPSGKYHAQINWNIGGVFKYSNVWNSFQDAQDELEYSLRENINYHNHEKHDKNANKDNWFKKSRLNRIKEKRKKQQEDQHKNDIHENTILLKKTPGNVKHFLDDIRSTTTENPISNKHRVLGNHGMFTVERGFDDNEAYINDIRSFNPKSGAGTHILKHITNLADKHNINLSLYAKAYDKKSSIQTKHLVDWYKKHGFKEDGYGDNIEGYDMVRKPQSLKESIIYEGVEYIDSHGVKIKVFKNPSYKTLLNGKTRYNKYRGIYDGKDHFLWDSDEAVHDDINKHLGLNNEHPNYHEYYFNTKDNALNIYPVQAASITRKHLSSKNEIEHYLKTGNYDGLKEDAPTNSAGGGAIAGIGVGPSKFAEPGFPPFKKRKLKSGILRRKYLDNSK